MGLAHVPAEERSCELMVILLVLSSEWGVYDPYISPIQHISLWYVLMAAPDMPSTATNEVTFAMGLGFRVQGLGV